MVCGDVVWVAGVGRCRAGGFGRLWFCGLAVERVVRVDGLRCSLLGGWI